MDELECEILTEVHGQRTVVTYLPAIVIHDDEGIRALSLACSHLFNL